MICRRGVAQMNEVKVSIADESKEARDNEYKIQLEGKYRVALEQE